MGKGNTSNHMVSSPNFLSLSSSFLTAGRWSSDADDDGDDLEPQKYIVVRGGARWHTRGFGARLGLRFLYMPGLIYTGEASTSMPYKAISVYSLTTLP